MDDDLLDLRPLLDIPITYAFRLWHKVTSKRKWILSTHSELWVSTPYLAEKYAKWNPRLLRPVVSGPLLKRSWESSLENSSQPFENTHSLTSETVRICYHGTWSHRDDMKWLAPVVAEVQRRCHNTVFEIIGGYQVAKIFKDIPRVVVIPTMIWSNYIKHTQLVHQDIGLAPLRDTLFNRGRGPIKFFDYARAGAVGIYSAGPAYSEFVQNGVDGFVLENNHSIWVKKIIDLVNSRQLRQIMAYAAWRKVIKNSSNPIETQENKSAKCNSIITGVSLNFD